MRILHRIIATVSLAAAFGLLLSGLAACPFCLSPPQTYSEQIRRADVVVIAELLRFCVLDHGTRPESTLRIRQVLRGREFQLVCPEIAPGQVLVVNKEAAGSVHDMFLMYGDLPIDSLDSDGRIEKSVASTSVTSATFRESNDQTSAAPGDTSAAEVKDRAVSFTTYPLPSTSSLEKTAVVLPELICWNDVSLVTPVTVEYLQQLPDQSINQSERLRFFLEHLEHPDPAIAIDAWAEFGNSTYEQVVSVRKSMPQEKLRAWIADPMVSPERLGLYGMMLGLCGDQSDEEFLLSQMTESPLPVLGFAMAFDQLAFSPSLSVMAAIESTPVEAMPLRIGAEGLLGGYLLLARENGIDVLNRQIPENGDAAFAYCQALQFLWSYEPTLIPADRLRSTMRRFLSSERIQSIAISNLSRWEDWDALPQLQASFDSMTDPASQRAVIEFTQVYLKSVGKKPIDDRHRPASEVFLESAKMNHPELFTARFGEFGPPKP